MALVLIAVLLLTGREAEARRYASIVIDANSGRVLHQENPNRQAYPASLTKIMTMFMIFEALDRGQIRLDQSLPVSRRASGMPASKLGLRRGSKITVEQAILALATKSANDVAVVVAEALGGTESNFARMMTEKARALGMNRTMFRNASGLPNKKQLSTARDMATLAQALMRRFPHHYHYFKSTAFTYKGRTYGNHNKLLKSYRGTDGIKTGYTRASGFNLVASVVRNNRRLIAVVFGGKTGGSRDRHMRKLLDRGFTRIMTASIEPLKQPPARKPWGEAVSILASVHDRSAPAPAQPKAAAVEAKPAESPTVASLDGAPQFDAIPKRPDYHTAMGAPGSRVPLPPKPDAIPRRPDYETAQGSRDAPTPKPPARDAIPQRQETPSSDASIKPGAALAPAAGAPGSSHATSNWEFRVAAVKGRWGIQVGAFSRIRLAEVALHHAASRAPSYLGKMEKLVSPAGEGNGKVYRARFTGTDEAGARATCGKLLELKLPCHVVPPGGKG